MDPAKNVLARTSRRAQILREDHTTSSLRL